MTGTEPARVTVARNIRRLCLAAGWSQDEARNRLAAHGIAWTKQVWSIAERSVDGGAKVRVFAADEVAALAATFGVTPNVLFGVSEPMRFVPAVDDDGRPLWLTLGGEVVRNDEVRDGWQRLYVAEGGSA